MFIIKRFLLKRWNKKALCPRVCIYLVALQTKRQVGAMMIQDVNGLVSEV